MKTIGFRGLHNIFRHTHVFCGEIHPGFGGFSSPHLHEFQVLSVRRTWPEALSVLANAKQWGLRATVVSRLADFVANFFTDLDV